MSKLRTLLVLSLLMSAVFLPASSSGAATRISGRVVSDAGAPVPGATVIVMNAGVVITGTASGDDGRFELRVETSALTSIELRVSSVGFEDHRQVIPIDSLPDRISIALCEKAVEVPGMRVTPLATPEPRRIVAQKLVAARAAQSLVMTNPVAAIKDPQVTRVGSNHSSQIRVHGTSPEYFLNGLPIGTDPAHYGMFSYVPTSIIDQMEFAPLGTTVDRQLPSVVEFDTGEPFGQASAADLNLSTIEATGTFTVATERAYLRGSLRKSVLDRLVKQFDISTDRATLPPTNFQDAFGTAGVRLSATTRLMIDHYRVRDYLSYNTSSVADVTSIDTYQSSDEKQLGVRVEDLRGAVITRLAASTRWGARNYRAIPSEGASSQAISVALSERFRTDFARAEVDFKVRGLLLKTGLETERDRYRDYSLEQHNWNFLPPFASTDNPFVYQQALNETYAERSGSAAQQRVSGFLSGETTYGPANLTLGVRHDRYTPFRNGVFTGVRGRLDFVLSESAGLGISWGTYSNSPLNNILEAYQVMVRANLEDLSPVETELGTLELSWRSIDFGLFRKTLRDLAIVSPDFSAVEDNGRSVQSDFIEVESKGSAVFDGLYATLREDRLWNERLGVSVSYAHTVSRAVDHGIVTRYALDVPHRFQAQADFKWTRRFTVGAELQVRSGYPYSPLRTDWHSDETRLYDWEHYRATLQDENSLRFATNAYLNLSGTYRFGRVELLVSVANVTNRANPVVYSSAGLIYDAGILPMIGLRMAL